MAKYRRIGTVALQYGDPRVSDRQARERETVLHYIDVAGRRGIDVLLFQEEFGFTWTSVHLAEHRSRFAPGELRTDLPSDAYDTEHLAIAPDDPYILRVREAAGKAGVNVALPILEKSGDRVYNSLLPVTSKGLPLRPYRKKYPVIGEMNSGVSPGTDDAVQLLAGVPVGFSICNDIYFDEVYASARHAGAMLMLWSSMWMGGAWLRARSTRFGFYMAAATPDGCSFVDMDGSPIVESYTSYPQTVGDNNLVFEDLNFDRDVFHCAADGKLNAIADKYGSKVHIRNRPQDCMCVIETLDESVSIEQLKEEFQLKHFYDYLEHSKAARNRALLEQI